MEMLTLVALADYAATDEVTNKVTYAGTIETNTKVMAGLLIAFMTGIMRLGEHQGKHKESVGINARPLNTNRPSWSS